MESGPPVLLPEISPSGTIQLKQTRTAHLAYANTGGPSTPSTVAGTAASPCSDNMTWTVTAGDLTSNDSNFVDITGTAWDATDVTDELRMSNFGFSLTGGTVTSIDGFQVDFLGWTPSGTPAASYYRVSLFTAPGTNRGDNKASGTFPTTDPGSTYQTFGATNDDWYPAGTWTQSEVESTGFGVALCLTSGEANATLSLDQVRITVTYTVATITEPTVTLSAATLVADTTARLNGDVTATGGENPTVTIYWGDNDGGTTEGNWDNNSTPTSPSQPQGVAAFYKDATGLPSGTTIYFSAKATNSGGTDWPPASLSFLTKPAAPTNVAATDGTYTDKVTITWTKSTGATGYRVYRDAVDVSGLLGDVATYDDTGAGAPSITAGTASATDGSSTSQVTLSIAGESANNGTSHTYKVVAVNATGNSVDSATDTGYRGVGTLTYQWYRSSGDADSGFSSLGGATTDPYDDSTAPAPTITPGTASATDGTQLAYVTLSLSGESANVGAGRYYYATLSATGAASQDTNHNRGYIGVGSLSYQWQRSAADSDASYSNISSAITDPYDDTGAPADGSGRYFKCVLSAAGAADQTSTADRGYRGFISITLEPGSGTVTYGLVGNFQDTTASGVNQTQTVRNTGNIAEKFDMKGQSSANWTLGAAAGDAVYVHQWCTSDCDGTPTWNNLTTSYDGSYFATNVAANGTADFDLKVTIPSANPGSNQQNVDVYVQAYQQ